MAVEAECYTVVATSQENPRGHFRFSSTPEALEKEIHALIRDYTFQISGSEGCLFSIVATKEL